jgi:hypothetical protein
VSHRRREIHLKFINHCGKISYLIQLIQLKPTFTQPGVLVETFNNSLFKYFGADATLIQSLVLLGSGFLLAILVLIYRARRTQISDDPLLSDSLLDKRSVNMKLKPIQLLSDDGFTEVQVIVYVNGAEFLIPPTESEHWLRVEADMKEEVIELPKADIYHIRFELNFRTGRKLEGGPVLARGISTRSASQKTTGKTPFRLLTLPIMDEYNLYFLDDGSRDMSVKAVIPYEIYAQ